MRIEEKTVSDIPQLIHSLEEDTKDVGQVWYRGHSVKEWKLEPSIFRQNYPTETDLMKEFKKDAMLLVDHRPEKPHEWLFIMRHYGIPTRLLDWTESPLVATYFAVSEEENSGKDGAVWALIPLGLNGQQEQGLPDPGHLPTFEEDPVMDSYNPGEFDRGVQNVKLLPIAFLAPRTTKRMQAQLTAFTIHHRKRVTIDEVGDGKHVWKYVIPSGQKDTVKKQLELLGITRLQLYPELESIRERLKKLPGKKFA